MKIVKRIIGWLMFLILFIPFALILYYFAGIELTVLLIGGTILGILYFALMTHWMFDDLSTNNVEVELTNKVNELQNNIDSLNNSFNELNSKIENISTIDTFILENEFNTRLSNINKTVDSYYEDVKLLKQKIQTINNEVLSRKQVIQDWKLNHPNGTKSACAKDTGISRNTINKYW